MKDCIINCTNVPACKGLTFSYGAPSRAFDNCWLKGATDVSTYTKEDDGHVQFVSLTKPVEYKACFQEKQCLATFILSVIGTALGVLSTLMSVVHSGLHLKDQHFRAILRTASRRRTTAKQQAHPYDASGGNC